MCRDLVFWTTFLPASSDVLTDRVHPASFPTRAHVDLPTRAEIDTLELRLHEQRTRQRQLERELAALRSAFAGRGDAQP